MIDIAAFQEALGIMFTSVGSWGWIVPGLIVGLVFSAIPGVSITMAMAIVLPMSLYMDFFSAIVFLTSVYTGAGFGGSVPAILMNIPGSPSSFATTFDGDWDPYIDDFVTKIPDYLDIIDSAWEGWPGIRSPEAKDYLAKHQVTAEGWYVGNPDLTVAETRRLKRLGEAVDEFLDKIED